MSLKLKFSNDFAKTVIGEILKLWSSNKRKVAANLRDIADRLRSLKATVDSGQIPRDDSHYIMTLGNYLRRYLHDGSMAKYPDDLVAILEKLDALNEKLMVADVFIDISHGVDSYKNLTEEVLRKAIETSGLRDLPPADLPVYGFADSEQYLPFLQKVASRLSEDALALAGELDAFASAIHPVKPSR